MCDVITSVDYETQHFLYILLNKNWFILDSNQELLYFIIHHSYTLFCDCKKEIMSELFCIIIYELSKESLKYSFDMFSLYFNNIYMFTCVERWFEVFSLICTRYSRLPDTMTPLELSDLIFDAAITENNHLLIENLLNLMISCYGEEQALTSICIESISSILLSEQPISYPYLIFVRKKLIYSAEEHILFISNLFRHSNAKRCVSILEMNSAKVQKLIAEILCNTLATTYQCIIKENVDIIKDILTFTANANIEATTHLMLTLVRG